MLWCKECWDTNGTHSLDLVCSFSSNSIWNYYFKFWSSYFFFLICKNEIIHCCTYLIWLLWGSNKIMYVMCFETLKWKGLLLSGKMHILSLWKQHSMLHELVLTLCSYFPTWLAKWKRHLFLMKITKDINQSPFSIFNIILRINRQHLEYSQI